MNWKIGIVIALLIATIGIGVFFFLTGNDGGKTKTKSSVDKTEEVIESEVHSEEDLDTEVVHTPAAKSIITLNNGTDGHTFIKNYHDFYNRTLGWGAIETASYEAQKEAAQTILNAIESAEVQDEDLAEDFERIRHFANDVLNNDDRGSMRMLHRYFHDLDIHLNGYSGDQAWGVTEYKAK